VELKLDELCGAGQPNYGTAGAATAKCTQIRAADAKQASGRRGACGVIASYALDAICPVQHDEDLKHGSRLSARSLPFRELREIAGKTQGEMASLLETDQGEISRLEQRSNVETETLRRYAAALGFTCKVVFESAKGKRVVVALHAPPRVHGRK
jgi:hypothetical protein